MPHRIPWDGREHVRDALVRNGLADVFRVAFAAGDGTTAVLTLLAVGVDL
jgi:hypothetical protein